MAKTTTSFTTKLLPFFSFLNLSIPPPIFSCLTWFIKKVFCDLLHYIYVSLFIFFLWYQNLNLMKVRTSVLLFISLSPVWGITLGIYCNICYMNNQENEYRNGYMITSPLFITPIDLRMQKEPMAFEKWYPLNELHSNGSILIIIGQMIFLKFSYSAKIQLLQPR